jgi:hypothetical protein
MHQEAKFCGRRLADGPAADPANLPLDHQTICSKNSEPIDDDVFKKLSVGSSNV